MTLCNPELVFDIGPYRWLLLEWSDFLLAWYLKLEFCGAYSKRSSVMNVKHSQNKYLLQMFKIQRQEGIFENCNWHLNKLFSGMYTQEGKIWVCAIEWLSLTNTNVDKNTYAVFWGYSLYWQPEFYFLNYYLKVFYKKKCFDKFLCFNFQCDSVFG